MEVLFLGVGEACDPNEPNTSLVIKDFNGRGVLLVDCGFTTPHQYYAKFNDPNELLGVWISHFHGDHFFGLPLLLLRMHQMGRKKALRIYGSKDIAYKVDEVMNSAYPSCKNTFKFAVECIEMVPGITVKIGELSLCCAEVDHSQNAMAVSIVCKEKKLFYSGDGRPTDNSIKLAQESDIIVHESFSLRDDFPGHCNLKQVLDFLRRAQCKRLAIVHINYMDRLLSIKEFKEKFRKLEGKVECFIPSSGTCYVI